LFQGVVKDIVILAESNLDLVKWGINLC
jgi:hypothetical protein